MRFDIVLRRGATETPLATFTHAYPAGSTAQYDDSAAGPAAGISDGDVLVLRVTTVAPANAEYIPYAEGASTAAARYLELDLPK